MKLFSSSLIDGAAMTSVASLGKMNLSVASFVVSYYSSGKSCLVRLSASPEVYFGASTLLEKNDPTD